MGGPSETSATSVGLDVHARSVAPPAPASLHPGASGQACGATPLPRNDDDRVTLFGDVTRLSNRRQAQCHACSVIHVVVKRSIAGMLSAKPAPMAFSSLPPTNGILTSTLTAERSCEPLPAGASHASARPDPNPPEPRR